MISNNALTTLEKVKGRLGIPLLDTTQDEDLEFFINSASATIEKYCNRKFGLTVFNELKQGRGNTKLILENYPIVELVEILIDDQPVDITKVKVLADTGMLYRPNGGFPSSVFGGRLLHPIPDDVQHNIYVEYSAGYVLPKDETVDNPRTLPFDIENACLRMISIMQKDKQVAEGNNLILKRETIGDWVAEYEPENKSTTIKLDLMDADILSVLDLYKKAEFSI